MSGAGVDNARAGRAWASKQDAGTHDDKAIAGIAGCRACARTHVAETTLCVAPATKPAGIGCEVSMSSAFNEDSRLIVLECVLVQCNNWGTDEDKNFRFSPYAL